MHQQSLTIVGESVALLRERFAASQNRDKTFKVLFVCTGNICRSPLAHAVFAHKVRERGLDADFELESAGTEGYHIGENADHRARKAASNHGVRLDHSVRKLSEDDISYYDVIFAMDAGHFRRLHKLSEEVKQKIGVAPPGSGVSAKSVPMDSKAFIVMYRDFDPNEKATSARRSGSAPDVPDPYYDGMAAFEHVYDIVDRCAEAVLDALLPTNRS